MESITALSSRLLFSDCPLLIDHPFPIISKHERFILDSDALKRTIMDLLAIDRIYAAIGAKSYVMKPPPTSPYPRIERKGTDDAESAGS